MAIAPFPNPTTQSGMSTGYAQNAKAITPSDVDTFDRPVRIFIGAGGILNVTTAGGQNVTLVATAGDTPPLMVTAVKSTGTLAGMLVALY